MVAGPGHGLVGRARKVLNVPGMRGAAFCVVLWRFVLCCDVLRCVVLWRFALRCVVAWRGVVWVACVGFPGRSAVLRNYSIGSLSA